MIKGFRGSKFVRNLEDTNKIALDGTSRIDRVRSSYP